MFKGIQTRSLEVLYSIWAKLIKSELGWSETQARRKFSSALRWRESELMTSLPGLTRGAWRQKP